jgi:hypothetical protein
MNNHTEAKVLTDTTGTEINVHNTVEDSITYFMLPDDSVVNGDDWTEHTSASDDYWVYVFKADELGLLEHYLNDATDTEINNLLHVLVLGTGQDNDFHHALYCVLRAFK